MRITLFVVGGLFILIGAVWILQGTNILPGSAMSGSSFWGIMGTILVIVGIALESIGSRIKKKK